MDGTTHPKAPPMVKTSPLLLSTLLLALTRPAWADEIEGSTLQLHGDHLLASAPTEGLRPGGTVAVYVEERRPDPRGGEVVGLRYAGDARLVWVSDGLVELALAEGAEAPAEGRVLLGSPRGLAPTPPWSPPPPPVAPPSVEAPAAAPAALATAPVEREVRPSHLPGLGEDLDGAPLGDLHARRDGPASAIIASGGWAGDGYDTGAGAAALTWRYRPTRGPGEVSVGLEGSRGRRWVQGASDDDPWATEAVAGAWLWTRMDSASVGFGLSGGLGLGVDAEGPTLATHLGLRSGDPDGSRIELDWEHLGRLGDRVSLDGRVALAEPIRLGARARIGDLPRHDGDARQRRGDGALILSVDLGAHLRLTAAGGLGAYDLLIADAGPVFDSALEITW